MILSFVIVAAVWLTVATFAALIIGRALAAISEDYPEVDR